MSSSPFFESWQPGNGLRTTQLSGWFWEGEFEKNRFQAPPVEIYRKSWCIPCDGGWLILTFVICRVCWFVHGFHTISDCNWADVVAMLVYWRARYCWWFGHPANQLRFVVNPRIKRGLYIPGGQVVRDFFHERYQHSKWDDLPIIKWFVCMSKPYTDHR